MCRYTLWGIYHSIRVETCIYEIYVYILITNTRMIRVRSIYIYKCVIVVEKRFNFKVKLNLQYEPNLKIGIDLAHSSECLN